MQTKKNNKSKPHTTSSFFSKKPTSARLRDLNLLQKAYKYLNNVNPSGDSKRKQMRGVQLAQQLVDPRINSIQTVLTVLASKIAQVKAGYPLEKSGINTADDNARRYLGEFGTSDYVSAWTHYANSLLNIPLESSIIETDVYNYSPEEIIEDIPPDDEDSDNTDEPDTNSVITRSINSPEGSQPKEPISDTPVPERGNFLTRIFRNLRRNN